jgi:uncharacterized membrane protein YedE/YeeE
MARELSALAAGLLFGFGLALAGMVDPAKVLNFLDPFGAWDPSLIFVMGGGAAIGAVGFRLVRLLDRPLFAGQFRWPTRADIDARLVGGAALFGIGWGLVGFCPGPALSALVLEPRSAAIFVAAMVAGMVAVRVAMRAEPAPG